jgi:glycosyltransferase involved in cell wall biosynthesis
MKKNFCRSYKKIVIVSLYGITNAGGVERVCYYLYEILSKKYPVQLVTKLNIKFGKFDTLLQPILMSIRLCFIRNKIVFSNSWQSFLYPVDFCVHHGTTKGFTMKIPETETFGSTIISLMEKISCKTARRIIAVSNSAARELMSLYGADPEKITILNNFVDEHLFYPS